MLKKKLIFGAIVAILLSACGPTGKQFNIEGKVKNMQDGEIYIYSLDDNARFDTLQVKSGNFSYHGTAERPTPYFIVFQNAMEQVVFVDAGKTLKYEASANDMKNYTVKGSDENELLNDFRKNVAKMAPVKTKAEAKNFIQQHPTSPVATYVLDRYFIQDVNSDIEEMMTLAELLKKNNPKDIYLIELVTNIKALKACSVGASLPKIKLTTKTGRTIDLANPSKKFTLLAFWATWMDEEWDFRTTMRDIYNDHSDKIDVIAVSLDTQIFKWEEAVKNDSTTVSHVCDGMAWDSPAAKFLAVRQMPFFVIADEKSKIIEMGKSIAEIKSTTNKVCNQ